MTISQSFTITKEKSLYLKATLKDNWGKMIFELRRGHNTFRHKVNFLMQSSMIEVAITRNQFNKNIWQRFPKSNTSMSASKQNTNAGIHLNITKTQQWHYIRCYELAILNCLTLRLTMSFTYPDV